MRLGVQRHGPGLPLEDSVKERDVCALQTRAQKMPMSQGRQKVGIPGILHSNRVALVTRKIWYVPRVRNVVLRLCRPHSAAKCSKRRRHECGFSTRQGQLREMLSYGV